jgi:hypothetical protein
MKTKRFWGDGRGAAGGLMERRRQKAGKISSVDLHVSKLYLPLHRNRETTSVLRERLLLISIFGV